MNPLKTFVLQCQKYFPQGLWYFVFFSTLAIIFVNTVVINENWYVVALSAFLGLQRLNYVLYLLTVRILCFLCLFLYLLFSLRNLYLCLF